MSPCTALDARLQRILAARERHSARRRLTLAKPGDVDFSSNDFLSLARSPALRAAYLAELAGAGAAVPLGSGGSRLLDGNSAYAEGIEAAAAAFHGAPAGLLFNSGFDANAGFFASVPQPGDVVLYDAHVHASVHEGVRLSRARAARPFAHNSVADLARVLRAEVASDAGVRGGERAVFVAVETVYSMAGDVAPVAAMLDVLAAACPAGNAHLVVDEAHATGVYGPAGRGVVCALGLEDRVLARLHTFGKALSSGGAIVLCSPTLREYLINYARSLIYTTAMGLPTLAMVKTVYRFLEQGWTEEAREKLWSLMHYLQQRLQQLPSSSLISMSSGPPESPIFSVRSPFPRLLAGHCQARGFMVRPIVPPTVPEGGQMIRICLHSGNSVDEVDRLVAAIRDWVNANDGLLADVEEVGKSRL